jgi:L-lactate dehydrogenase (cytochrome)
MPLLDERDRSILLAHGRSIGALRMSLERCFSIDDLRRRAQARLPRPIFDYMDGAAETESTARRNEAWFDAIPIVPKCLVDVATISTSTRVLGADLNWPLICGPTGASRFYHPDGELAVARAAAKAGIIYSASTMATHSLEAIAAASSGPKMFQLYIFKDRGVTRALVERSKAAGFSALCLTVDAAIRGKRERELRSGMGVPLALRAAGLASFALHPRWLLGQAQKGAWSMPNFAEATGSNDITDHTRFVGRQLDASVTWDDIGAIMEAWDGPFAIKGVMSVEDARRAADLGVSAIIVSNHGGRQLDGAVATVEMLPEIVAAVGDRVDIIVDGGIRRGVHMLKALALGAKACAVGRAYLYGLAAGGEVGVARALEVLRTEFTTAMKLSGCLDASRISSDVVRSIR